MYVVSAAPVCCLSLPAHSTLTLPVLSIRHTDACTALLPRFGSATLLRGAIGPSAGTVAACMQHCAFGTHGMQHSACWAPAVAGCPSSAPALLARSGLVASSLQHMLLQCPHFRSRISPSPVFPCLFWFCKSPLHSPTGMGAGAPCRTISAAVLPTAPNAPCLDTDVFIACLHVLPVLRRPSASQRGGGCRLPAPGSLRRGCAQAFNSAFCGTEAF